jgi:hypothetical protein
VQTITPTSQNHESNLNSVIFSDFSHRIHIFFRDFELCGRLVTGLEFIPYRLSHQENIIIITIE